MPAPLPTALRVASAIGYAWGAVMALLSIAAAIPAVAQGGAVAPLALPLLLSIASAVAADGIRRRRWPFVALGVSAAWIAFLLLVPLALSFAGAALNVVILGLVATNLRRFG